MSGADRLSAHQTNQNGNRDVVPGDELSTDSKTKRSSEKRQRKSLSDDRQYMMVGEQKESVQASEVEEISNPNVKNDGVLRPILSQKGHKLKLNDQTSADYSATETNSRTQGGSEYTTYAGLHSLNGKTKSFPVFV